MTRHLIFFIGFFLTSWSISHGQIDYLQSGNDCFDKGDYECAKRNYNSQKIFASIDGMDEKIAQCDKCIHLLATANNLFSAKKDYAEAKKNYQALLAINPKDPYAKQQIEACDKNITSIWKALYEEHLTRGDGFYRNQNYQSAIEEYNQALRQIPSDATNASELKNNINSKITDCANKIKEKEEQEKREKERQAQLKREAETKERQAKQQREAEAAQKLKTLKSDANNAFEAKNWDRAYTLYQNIKSLDSNDYTGYNNFFKKGKDLMAIVGCDNNVKDFLTKAKNLRNTNEVNELINKCNR